MDARAVAEELGVQPDRGLGAGEAAERLRTQGPNRLAGAKKESGFWVRLCVQGAVMTAGTQVAYRIGEANFDFAVAATMLLSTLSLFHLAAGLLARDQVNTIFRRDFVPGATQLRRTASPSPP
jgi:Ca2+-transporting ATPase